MASGLGGSDWFEVAGRLAQAETDIGLGRIVGQRHQKAKKDSTGVQSAPIKVGSERGKHSLETNSAGSLLTFGPPSPPLKRHAAPLSKEGPYKSSENKEQVELDDVTSRKYIRDMQSAGAGTDKSSESKRNEGGTIPALRQVEEDCPSGDQEATRHLTNTGKQAAGPVELPDLVGSQSEGEDAERFLDWSRPSPKKHTPPAASPSLPRQPLIEKGVHASSSKALPEDRTSIWEFNQGGEEQETKGALPMEELPSPHSRMSEGPQEDWVLVHPENRQVSRFGALPSWSLAQTGLLSTSLGQRVASFVGDVVAASAEHEQRFAGRLRNNSWPRGEESAELKVLSKSPSENQVADEGLAETGDVQKVSEPAAAVEAEASTKQHMPEAEGSREIVEASNADWVSRIQSATTHQLGEWLARIKTTYRGSKEDIGWLQHEPGMQPVTDGTERFLQLLGQIVHGIHSLPDDHVYLLTPGLFSNFGQLYLYDTKKYLAKLGLSTHIAKIHSEAAVEKNALEICQYVEELNWGTGKQVVILGHSKGGIDACAALALYPERLNGKVRGIALVQSPYAGNPVCSDILREGQVADFGSRAVLQALMQHALKGELRALEDLTYEHRRAFIRSHPLPPGFPLVSFHTEASRAPTALSAITTVGHAELPLAALVAGATTSQAAPGLGKLPIGFPVGATLATVAGHLELRYGEKSDGLVTRRDAEVPGSVAVRPEKKLDHAWPVFGGKSAPGEPEPAHVNEALLTLLLESQFEAGHAPSVRPVRTGDPPRRWR